MKYLAIDYGLKHLGLAISDGYLAEPYGQFTNETVEKTIAKIVKTCSDLRIEKVILGISENTMARLTQNFAMILQKSLDCEVIFFDETLSTQEAGQILLKAKAKKKKRQEKKHAVAAAVILQNYLDEKNQT
jgi:putative holliday junction resolvase